MLGVALPPPPSAFARAQVSDLFKPVPGAVPKTTYGRPPPWPAAEAPSAAHAAAGPGAACGSAAPPARPPQLGRGIGRAGVGWFRCTLYGAFRGVIFGRLGRM